MFGCWFSALLMWVGSMGITPPGYLGLLADDAQVCLLTNDDSTEAPGESDDAEALADTRTVAPESEPETEGEGEAEEDEEGESSLPPVLGISSTVSIYNGF